MRWWIVGVTIYVSSADGADDADFSMNRIVVSVLSFFATLRFVLNDKYIKWMFPDSSSPRVIQSEAKNLGNIKLMLPRSFTNALDDKIIGRFYFDILFSIIPPSHLRQPTRANHT